MWSVPEGVMPVSVRMKKAELRGAGAAASIPPRQQHHPAARLGDGGRRQAAGKGHGGHHQRALAEDGAGVEHGVAADLGVIADDGAEFTESGFKDGLRGADDDGLLIEAQIRARSLRPRSAHRCRGSNRRRS